MDLLEHWLPEKLSMNHWTSQFEERKSMSHVKDFIHIPENQVVQVKKMWKDPLTWKCQSLKFHPLLPQLLPNKEYIIMGNWPLSEEPHPHPKVNLWTFRPKRILKLLGKSTLLSLVYKFQVGQDGKNFRQTILSWIPDADALLFFLLSLLFLHHT